MLRWSMRFVRRYSTNVQPIEMAYNTYGEPGEKPPLVIMHGLFGSKQNWRGISRAVESKSSRQVFAVDARNHGDSPHTDKHRSSHMAADVMHFIKTQTKHGKAAVMGHSMGGRTMMHLALQHSDFVERAIIVDISPIEIPRDFYTMTKIFKAMLNVSVPPELPMSQGRAMAEAQMKAAVDDDDTVNFIMLNLRKRESGEFYWAANVAGLLKNLKNFSEFMKQVDVYPSFQGPVMFICGTHSSFVDPDHWPAIQTIFPNSEIHWLDAGHLVHLEQPAKFVELVVNFLKN